MKCMFMCFLDPILGLMNNMYFHLEECLWINFSELKLQNRHNILENLLMKVSQ